MNPYSLIFCLSIIGFINSLQINTACETGCFYSNQAQSCQLCSAKTPNCLTCDTDGKCLTCRGSFLAWLDPSTQQQTCSCPYGQIRVYNATNFQFNCVDWKTALSQFNPAGITKLGRSITLDQLKNIYSLTLYLNQYEHEVDSPTQLIANHLLYSQGSIMETTEKLNILSSIYSAFGLLPIKQYTSYNILIQLSQLFINKNLTSQAIANLFEFTGLLSEKIGKNGGLDYGTSDYDTITQFLNNAQNLIDKLKTKALSYYSLTISDYQSFRYSNLWIGISKVNRSQQQFSTALGQNQYTFSAKNAVISQLPQNQNLWFVQIVQEINLFQYLPNKAVNMGSSLQNVQFFVQNYTVFTAFNNFTNVGNNVILTFQMNKNQYNATLYNYISQNSSWSSNGPIFTTNATPISLQYSLFGMQAKWKNYLCNQGEYQFSYNQCEVCESRISNCLTCNQQTGECLTCSGLVPAWKNIGSIQQGCNCPTGYMIVRNNSFFCQNSTIVGSYWSNVSSQVMAMSGQLSNDQLKLLEILSYTINGNDSLIYLNIVAKKLIEGISLTSQQQVALAASILLGLAQNSQSSYQILNNIILLPHEIALTNYCNSTILNTLMEFFGLVFSKISQQTFDFSSATSTQKALFLDNLVNQFHNVKVIYLSNTNTSPNSYHFSSIYINVFKGLSIFNNFSSILYQNQFQLNLDSKSLSLLSQYKPISALHIIFTKNLYANYPNVNATIPSNLMMIDFYQGLNYKNANQKLQNLAIYANTMTFSYLWNSQSIALNYWQLNSPFSKWIRKNDFLYLYSERNITCFFESLAYSSLYGLKTTD